MFNSRAIVLAASTVLALSACNGDGSFGLGISSESGPPATVSPNEQVANPEANNPEAGNLDPANPDPVNPILVVDPAPAKATIKVLSNRADMISDGNALVELVAQDKALLDGVKVMAGTVDVSSKFAKRANGRVMALLENLPLGTTQIVATLADKSVTAAQVTNHPNGGPVFSGPQVKPWTCTNAKAVDVQCNQPAEYSFKYLPANKLQHVLRNSDLANQEFAPTLVDYDPKNPPAASEIAVTTTDAGVTVPFIVRIERGVQNRDRYQIVTLFQPNKPWTAFAPQEQWNRKLLIHHGGNVGVTFGPGNPPNGDISGTAPDGAEFLLGDSITVALGRGFMTLSTALSNLGHNVNLVTSAESLVMAKERIVEQYGELRYTMGTGCSGGAIAQQHVANAFPGIYQGIIVQCSYPDVWTTATQFADYNLLNSYFGNRYSGVNEAPNSNQFPQFNTTFLPYVQWSVVYGHLPINPVLSDNAFFPKAYPTQANCPGLRDAEPQYDAVKTPGGLRCGLIDYLKTQFGTRTPDVWSANEKKLGRGFGGIPLDNVGVQYGLGALKQGTITSDQFLDLNRNIGGFSVDIVRITQRTTADPLALTNAYKTGAVNTAENLSNIPIIDLRGPDPGIAHDAYHSWQMRQRIKSKQGHFDNHVIWFGQFPLAGDSVYSTEALIVMDRWLSAIEKDNSNKTLPEKVRGNKPAAARDKCLSAQTLYSDAGPFIPLTGGLFFPDPIIPGANSSQLPKPDPSTGMIFDQVAKQFCGLDASAVDSSGQSAQVTGPVASVQNLVVQTRFGTPRTVAGDSIETLNNKCVLKPVDATDYAGSPMVQDVPAFVAKVKAIFPNGVCDYSKKGVGIVPTQTWLGYGSATQAIVGGQKLPEVPAGSRGGWAAPAFGLSR